MSASYPIDQADETLALRLIGWIVSDVARADRMVALTGLSRDDLRTSVGNPALSVALRDFVINPGRALVACAEALGVAPANLVAARERIGR